MVSPGRSPTRTAPSPARARAREASHQFTRQPSCFLPQRPTWCARCRRYVPSWSLLSNLIFAADKADARGTRSRSAARSKLVPSSRSTRQDGLARAQLAREASTLRRRKTRYAPGLSEQTKDLVRVLHDTLDLERARSGQRTCAAVFREPVRRLRCTGPGLAGAGSACPLVARADAGIRMPSDGEATRCAARTSAAIIRVAARYLTRTPLARSIVR
jgi:hypothetical protein